MADNARSPSICPWDPGEVCKAPHGASLPPRKRLLAGLKQNGWLCSTPPYFQGVSGASCAPEELRLEVDLRESKHECIRDAFSLGSPTPKQGECTAVEKSVSVKSKRASKRRKSLSVLVDFRNSVKNLHPELLKSCSENEIQERGRCNKVPKEALLYTEKPGARSYKQMVDDARAAAAKAAKAATEAKAIALEKAAVAAKAAAVARAALEAVALVAENEGSECQPSRHVWALCEQNRINNGESVNGLLEKTKANKRTRNGSVSSNENKKDEKTQAGKSSTAAFHPVDNCTVLKIKEDKGVHFGQNCIVALSGKHEEAEETLKTCAVACPMPPPSDDEKLARQLHRVMNSSPRIFYSRALSDNRRKIDSFPSSFEGCTQIRYQQVGGCSSSREKKQIHKLRVSRSNNRKADIKTKSMTAINDKLNMLQRATATRGRVLDSTGPCSATSREYANKFCQIDADSASDDADGTFVSFNKCIEKVDNFTGICDIDDSYKAGLKGEGNISHCVSYVHDSGTVGRDDELNATKGSRVIKKLKSRKKSTTAVCIPVSHQGWDDNRANELPFTCNDIQSDTTLNVVSEQTCSHIETYDEDYEGRRESQGGRLVSRPGIFVRGDASGTPTVKTMQEKIHSKSSRATRKISGLVLHGEMQKRGQKIMNGNLLNSISSYYVPSSTAL